MKRKGNFNRERERKGRRGGRIERNTSERICRFWCGSRQLSSNKIKAVVIKKKNKSVPCPNGVPENFVLGLLNCL